MGGPHAWALDGNRQRFAAGAPDSWRPRHGNADEFANALKRALAEDSTLILDLSGLTFIDAAGLRVILHAAASRNGLGPLTLLNADRVAWLLEAVGMQDLPTIRFGSGGDRHGG